MVILKITFREHGRLFLGREGLFSGVALHASRKCLISYCISPSFLEEKKNIRIISKICS